MTTYLLEEAIAITCEAHRGQTGKAGQPYILHPLRVMLAISGDEARQAAMPHDVMDLRRLARITARDVEQLEEYHQAWQALV